MKQQMTMELFFRHGERFAGKPVETEKGPVAVLPKICHRCGGAGGSDKWKHTGWTCFECGGARTLGTKAHKLFTAEKLAKLNATAAKKAAKKAAAAEAAAAVAKTEAEARRAEFMAVHGALLAKAEPFAERSEFVKDVLAKAHEKAALTENQAAALEAAVAKMEATDAKRAASGHVGKVGERLKLTVVAERVVGIETAFGLMMIATMRDSDGNAIVAKGRFVPPTANWNEDAGWKVTAEPFAIKATVKEHATFRGERQTIVQRVAIG